MKTAGGRAALEGGSLRGSGRVPAFGMGMQRVAGCRGAHGHQPRETPLRSKRQNHGALFIKIPFQICVVMIPRRDNFLAKRVSK